MIERDVKFERAKNPYDLKRPIELMVEGETAYTVPWAMWLNNDHKYQLHPKHRIHDKPCDHAIMKITRTSEGFTVDTSNINSHDWPARESPRYADPGDIDWLPVENLITEPSDD